MIFRNDPSRRLTAESHRRSFLVPTLRVGTPFRRSASCFTFLVSARLQHDAEPRRAGIAYGDRGNESQSQIRSFNSKKPCWPSPAAAQFLYSFLPAILDL